MRMQAHIYSEQNESEQHMNPIVQFILDFLNNTLGGFGDALQPLVALIGFTPPELSTANMIVIAGWHVMVAIADLFLGLFVIVGAMQMMYGQATGSLYTPVGQFLSR